MTIFRLTGLIPAAALFFLLALVPVAQALDPIQERTITDDGSPPAKTGTNAAKGEDSSSGKSAPASKSSNWSPPSGTKVEKRSAKDNKTPPAPANPEPAPVDSSPAGSADSSTPAAPGEDVFSMSDKEKTYGKNEIDREVMGFFEGGSQGLASLIAKAFNELGRPNGFIKGGEGSGAFVLGLRYGEGTLKLKNGQTRTVYWQSPSLGFDFGANASKVFVLVYGMEDPDKIFQRFPGVDGSAYFIGGFGMNYQRSGDVTLAPIRFGVGLRLGANVGYMHYGRIRTINPF